MTKIEILSLIITAVCLISFSIVFTYLFRNYFLNTIKEINDGRQDIEIIDEFLQKEKDNNSRKKKVLSAIGKVISHLILVVIIIFFGFSVTSRILGNSLLINDTGIVVIASGSMSNKNEDNKYLIENELNNQFDTYDIIGLQKYKSIDEVELYDVVAFKDANNNLIVHRIISIENVNGELAINTRGDSNNASDLGSLYKEPLRYENLVGKYNEFRVPLLGSFVIFLQSNSGIITICSIIYCFIMFDYYKTKLDKVLSTRTNSLIELINYDPSYPNVKNFFKQELIYKGYKYEFSEGKFISKTKLEDQTIKNKTDNIMYSSFKTTNKEDELVKNSIKKFKNNEIINSSNICDGHN